MAVVHETSGVMQEGTGVEVGAIEGLLLVVVDPQPDIETNVVEQTSSPS